MLFEHSSDAHLIFDDSGIIDCNNATVAMLRCRDKAQVLRLHPAVLSPEVQPDGQTSQANSIEMDRLGRERGFHRFEWTHRRMDGEDVPVEVTLTPVQLSTGPALLVVWHLDHDATRALTGPTLEAVARTVARAFLAAGADLSRVHTLGTLREGLERCTRR